MIKCKFKIILYKLCSWLFTFYKYFDNPEKNYSKVCGQICLSADFIVIYTFRILYLFQSYDNLTQCKLNCHKRLCSNDFFFYNLSWIFIKTDLMYENPKCMFLKVHSCKLKKI